jgi:hypothetical protein
MFHIDVNASPVRTERSNVRTLRSVDADSICFGVNLSDAFTSGKLIVSSIVGFSGRSRGSVGIDRVRLFVVLSKASSSEEDFFSTVRDLLGPYARKTRSLL